MDPVFLNCQIRIRSFSDRISNIAIDTNICAIGSTNNSNILTTKTTSLTPIYIIFYYRKSAVGQLQKGMASLASVSADVESSLAEVQKCLKEEQTKEKEFQEMVGPRASPILVELERETQKYHEAHSMASESNLTLNKAMRLHVKNLQLLNRSLPELEAEIPKLSDLDQSVLQCLGSIRNVIDKVKRHFNRHIREAA